MNSWFPNWLEFVFMCLLGAACGFFVLLPIDTGGGLTGEHYEIGWPMTTVGAKIGYISSESPSGLHLYFSILGLINPILWMAIFFLGYYLTVRLKIFGKIVYPAIILLFSIGLVCVLFFGFGFLANLVSD